MYAGTWRERGRGGHNEAKFNAGSERKSRVQEHASARDQLKTRRTRRALRNTSGFKEPDTKMLQFKRRGYFAAYVSCYT
jgi:hypothetical protein